jgi:crotonobetainyl-CoA:carnitine CoA-transferase CaiB-like acyl-CoA transferase
MLSSVRVLDLSRVLAGPSATQFLADLGATVIKVERPHEGDDTRRWGPPWASPGTAAYFEACNRNKMSICINHADEEGAALVRSLAANSDVVVENFKAGSLDKHGLGYSALSAINKKVVYASITGYGLSGPERSSPGYDYIMQARSGLMSITGPPGDPHKVGVAVVDLFCGMLTSSAVLAGLLRARETGEGCHVQSSLYESAAALLSYQANNLFHGAAPVARGNSHANIVPYDSLRSADGVVIVAAGNDTQYAVLCRTLGLAVEEKHRTNEGRVRDRDQVVALLERVTRTQTTAHWVSTLSPLGIMAVPVNTVDQFFSEPQAQHLKLKETVKRDDGTVTDLLRHPVQYNSHSHGHALVRKETMAPPRRGQHTDEILRNVLGIDDAQLAHLRSSKVIE